MLLCWMIDHQIGGGGVLLLLNLVSQPSRNVSKYVLLSRAMGLCVCYM